MSDETQGKTNGKAERQQTQYSVFRKDDAGLLEHVEDVTVGAGQAEKARKQVAQKLFSGHPEETSITLVSFPTRSYSEDTFSIEREPRLVRG